MLAPNTTGSRSNYPPPGSPKSQDESILSECLSHRAIQQNSTHPMPPSKETNSLVAIQWTTTRRWDTTGQVIETLPNHQYHVRVDGSGRITLRNHQFLRKLDTPTILFPIPSAVPETSIPNPTPHRPNTLVPQTMDTGITSSHLTSNTAQLSTSTQTKAPRALSRLFPHNQPGLKELIPPQRPQPTCYGGDIEW